MSVTFTCLCGKQLRVADEMRGQLVRCPVCHEVQTAPAAPDLSEPATPAPDLVGAEEMIRFRCQCGKLIQARATHAGRSTYCPACDAEVSIPASSETDSSAGQDELARIRTDHPAGRAVPSLDFEAEAEAAGARAGRGLLHDEADGYEGLAIGRLRPRRKSSPWHWVAAVAVLLLVVGGLVAAWYYLGGRITPDLALVPGNAQGFVTVRVADLWNDDYTRQVVAQVKRMNPGMPDLVAAAEKELGIAPTDIERLTFVADNIQNEVFWIIASTYQPYDRARILGKLEGAKERRQGSKVYQAGKKGEADVALHFHNERIFLVGSEKGIQRCLTLMEGKRVTGPLDSILKRASGKHHIVAGMTAPPELAALKGNLPAPAAGFASLLEFESASLLLDLNKGTRTTIEMGLSFPDRQKAKQAKAALENSATALKMLMPAFGDELKGMVPPGRQVNDLARALGSLKFHQSGSTVSVKMISAPGDPKQLIEAVKRGMEEAEKEEAPVVLPRDKPKIQPGRRNRPPAPPIEPPEDD